MRTKKLVIGITSVAIVAAAGLLFSSLHVSPDEARRAANAEQLKGVVNPESTASGMKSQATPTLSTKRFELPPTIATGSYTTPKPAVTAASR